MVLLRFKIKSLLIKVYPELKDQRFSIDTPTNLEFGDYSTNAAFVLAKVKGQNPVQLATEMVKKLNQQEEIKDLFDLEPVQGYINFTLKPAYHIQTIKRILSEKDNFGKIISDEPKRIIVEYFQNNVAKPSHIGHLRSAVIGDSLVRIFKYLGYQTITDTHVGDWGTQFGILLYAFKANGDRAVIERNPIDELYKLYVEMSAQIKENPTLRDKGKAEFKKLEDGDRENRELWEWFVAESYKDFNRSQELLQLLPFDYNLGESFYEDKMPQVIKEFEEKKLITVGEGGEKYIDLEKYQLGRCILIKSDGATTYHLRDFATYIYRKKQFNFYKNLYLVDDRQSHHFRQLFKGLELAGYPAGQDSLLVEFGYMSLPEGPISSRSGDIIYLQALVDEAIKRALKIIEVKNSELLNKEVVARQVALAAIKYFDLSHNRKTEIKFEWDKAISFEGNTGPYLQYTHARICGLIRKANLKQDPQISEAPISDNERLMLQRINQFSDTLDLVGENLSPNNLCNYLFELAQTFNSFYQSVPVLSEPDENKREFRLALCLATAQIIKNGLYLLGIEAPTEM